MIICLSVWAHYQAKYKQVCVPFHPFFLWKNTDFLIAMRPLDALYYAYVYVLLHVLLHASFDYNQYWQQEPKTLDW